MNSATLSAIQEKAAEIANQYTGGHLNARLRGVRDTKRLFNECKRVHYLYGVLSNVYLDGTDCYIGSKLITDAEVQQVSQKLWHYNGLFQNVDLSEFTPIVPDDGNSECVGSGATNESDHYRVGEVPVVAGTNVITFYQNGVPKPFSTTAYQVDPWVEAYSGYMQRNLVVTKLTNGFIVNDILEAGILKYHAILNS